MIIKVIDAYMLDNNEVDDVFYEEDGRVIRYKIALYTSLEELEKFKNKYKMFKNSGYKKIRLTIEELA